MGYAVHEAADSALQFQIANPFDAECEIRMYSVTGLFCPELRNLYHTQELLDKGMENSRDEITFNPEFKGATITSENRETSHPHSMILVMQDGLIAEFWRIEADPLNKFQTLYTLLFTLSNVQFNVIHTVNYDEFAIVQMDDQGIYIVIRPEIDGDEATFGCCDNDIGDGFTDFLFFDFRTQEINKWTLLPTEVANSYTLTIALT